MSGVRGRRRQTCGARARSWPAAEFETRMSPTWIWMQIAIVLLVVAGMVIAITKLA